MKLLNVGLATAAIVAMTALPSLARPGRVASGSEINVRDMPTTNSVVVAYAAGGEILEVLDSHISEEDGYGWYKVELRNRGRGWVRADLIRFGVPSGNYGPGRGSDTDLGYLTRLNAGAAGRKLAVYGSPSFDARISFYGVDGDQVRIDDVTADNQWVRVTYPKALRGVVSGGWVRRSSLR